MPKPQAPLVAPYLIARERLTRADVGRTPEPMVMDEPDSVAAFHESGERGGANTPVYELCAKAMSRRLPEAGTVLDLGSGSGQYLAHFARHRPDARIVGLDLSETMLATGRRMLAADGLADQVTLLEGDMTAFAETAPQHLDLVSSVYALHHLPTPDHLASCLAGIAAVRKARGCAVFLFDFARLKNPRSFPLFVSVIAGFPPALERDAFASERAAWSAAELTEALHDAGLGDLHHSVASPLPLFQVHWANARGTTVQSHDRQWRNVPLARGVRFDTGTLRRSLRGLP